MMSDRILRFLNVLRPCPEKADVLWILPLENLRPCCHVCPEQLVGGSIEITDLELTLPEAQVQEWIPDGAWAMHGVGEIVSTGCIVTAQKVCVTDGGEDPRRRLPFGPGLGKEIPGGPIVSSASA